MREALTILLVYSFLKNHSAMFEGGGNTCWEKSFKKGKIFPDEGGEGMGRKRKGEGGVIHDILA